MSATAGVSYHLLPVAGDPVSPMRERFYGPPNPTAGRGRGINSSRAETPVPPAMGRPCHQRGTCFLFSSTATYSSFGTQPFLILSVGGADLILGYVTQAWPIQISHLSFYIN